MPWYVTPTRGRNAGTPAAYEVATLVPQVAVPNDLIFQDGFDVSP